MSEKGIFITFEGGEGAGKTTQIQAVKSAMEAAGREVVVCRAPGGTPSGMMLREMLLHSTEDPVSVRAELLLFLADIAHLSETVILPALNSGKTVICDRFYDSTLAYQGYGRGLPVDEVSMLCAWAAGDAKPDYTFLLDLDPSTGLHRGDPDKWDKLESIGLEFHNKVRGGMLTIAALNPERVTVIDASADKESVTASILDKIDAISKPAGRETTVGGDGGFGLAVDRPTAPILEPKELPFGFAQQ